MAETEFRAPAFTNLTAADLTDDGNIALQFLDKDGRLYGVEIAKRLIGAVVLTIIGLQNKTQVAALDTTRRESDPITSLQLTVFRPSLTPKGEPGLAMVLEGALEVNLQMKRDTIPALKSVLDQLENLTSPPNDAQKH